MEEDDIFTGGFLVRDKDGQLKKVKDDRVVDYSPVSKPQSAGVAGSRSVSPRGAVTPASVPDLVRKPSPTKPISTSEKAAFYMDPEDEAEIQRHAQNLQQMINKPHHMAPPSIDDVVRQLLANHHLDLDDEVLQKRFYKIIESRLRGIRTSLETKDVLVRPRKIGGLELSSDTVELILKELDQAARKVDQGKRPVSPPPSQPPERRTYAPAPPPFVPRPGQPVSETPAAPKPTSPSIAAPSVAPAGREKKSIPPVSTSQPPTKTTTSTVKPAASSMSSGQAAQAPSQNAAVLYGRPAADLPRRAPMAPREPDRPQVVDIKQPRRTMGPVEELGDINLKEFRRLGNSPTEAADRILEKVELLEEESWKLKSDGIKAWKHSKTNQLYLSIGRESITTGISIQEVIKRRQQENKPYLLFEEFMAINHLNKQLTS